MNGFNVAEAGHVVQALPPQSISGGVTGPWFSVKKAEHVSIVILIGAIGASKPTAILLNAAQNVSGLNSQAIAFRYYLSSQLGGSGTGQTADLLSPPVVATTSGITASLLSKLNNEFIVIELDAAELESLGDGDGVDYPYLQLQITDSGNTTYMSAAAILSGVRFQYQLGATVTV